MDGWITHLEIISNSSSPPQVKQIIAQHFLGIQGEKVVFLVGDIPVPYSGQIYPDGHPDHEGAWPADPYYADLDGIWTDATVSSTQATSNRNHNLPGDGKFDQSIFVDIELQVGRASFDNLSGFADGPVELTRKYLDKSHRYKRKKFKTVARSVVDDNFGAFNGEAFASVAYKNFSTFHGIDSVKDADYVPSLRTQTINGPSDAEVDHGNIALE